ncbi:uncharacterized protein [Dermacentor andersoni]|uniref:uncharacterized protein n=1 Tax=Dermacentor andersoni TaxID=34620 RepID=UPI003B3A2E6A
MGMLAAHFRRTFRWLVVRTKQGRTAGPTYGYPSRRGHTRRCWFDQLVDEEPGRVLLPKRQAWGGSTVAYYSSEASKAIAAALGSNNAETDRRTKFGFRADEVSTMLGTVLNKFNRLLE